MLILMIMKLPTLVNGKWMARNLLVTCIKRGIRPGQPDYSYPKVYIVR